MKKDRDVSLLSFCLECFPVTSIPIPFDVGVCRSCGKHSNLFVSVVELFDPFDDLLESEPHSVSDCDSEYAIPSESKA